MTGKSGITAQGARITRQSRLLDLLIVIVLMIYAVTAIIIQWRNPYLLALLILPALTVLITRIGHQALSMAAAGALLGTTTEIFCVAGGLWSYANTSSLPFVPPWLILLWACFPIALLLIVRSILGTIPRVISGNLPLALIGIAIEILLFITLGRSTPLVIITSLPLAAAILIARPEKSTVILMAAGSLLGPACESMPVAAGAWSYATPEIMGMPAWLPLAYAMFAALIAYAVQSFGEHWIE